jgi:hypothetical protein
MRLAEVQDVQGRPARFSSELRAPAHEGRRRIKNRSAKSLGAVRRAWEVAGHDVEAPHVADMIDRGIEPVRGAMPTGASGAAFMSNLPPAGTFAMNTEVFSKNTERNDVPQKTETYPGFGATAIDVPIAKVGILSGCQIAISGTIKTGASGTVTPTFRWPWGLLRRIGLTANGQTSLISPSGLDVRARHSRVYRNPRDPITVAPSVDGYGDPTLAALSASTEYSVFCIYELPIVHDWYSLTGSLFMQSDQTYAALHLEMPSLEELFTVAGGGTVEFKNAKIDITTTTFDVPFATTSNGQVMLVPNLEWLHGFITNEKQYSNTGDVEVPLVRVSGELLALYLYAQNGRNAIIKPATWERFRMEYGANRTPRNFKPVQMLLQKNADDYNGLLLPEVGYVCLDFEADNPSRDLVFPKGVTELKVVPTISVSVSLNANSAIQFAEEALFAGR